MIFLKDPLYGFISIEEPFKSLIETKEFQRLRNIKQLGQSYLIYPSANHSRFEHSVGVFYLAQKMADKFFMPDLSMGDKKEFSRKEFMAAALLHDIGHYPFSHAIEKSIGLINNMTHENQAINIIKSTGISRILEKANLDVNAVCGLIEGEGKFGKLISGQIDVDRLDYLKRDSYYTGVAYGVVEIDVIIKTLTIKGKKYFVDEKYLPAFESILLSRYLMYSMVYMHRKTLIANIMLQAAFREALGAGEICADKLVEIDDIDFIGILRSSRTAAKDLIEQISQRNLYKEAIIFRKEDLMENINKVKNIKDISKIEKNIAGELKIKDHEILINILKFPTERKSEIIISPSGQNLEEISPIVQSLNMAEWNHWFVGVYCPEKHINKVKKAKKMIREYLLG